MRSTSGPWALALGVVAIALGAYALTRDAPDSSGLEERLLEVEGKVARIEAAVAALDRAAPAAPTLMGYTLEDEPGPPEPAGVAPVRGEDAGAEDAGGAASPDAPPRTAEEIQELVDKAVEKKAAQMQGMRNKKPPLDLFARTLGLDDAQREQLARDVVRAQHAIQQVLEIPADDGTNFIEELVEVMADGMAHPGENPGRGKALFGRLKAERIPGSDETYADRVEVLKNALRSSFERSWTAKQYATFEQWQMDPTQIQGIEGSPFKAIERRVVERARQLGAKLPGDAGR
jgi:hypothetical protein